MESVSLSEFDSHKKKCGASFESIAGQIDQLNRAVYGDKKNEVKGMADQVKAVMKLIAMRTTYLKLLHI